MGILELSDISVRFGGLQALTDVSFRVREGDIVGLIGPNGAGKTTVFNVITGVYKYSAGQVSYDGNPLAGKRPYQILAMLNVWLRCRSDQAVPERYRASEPLVPGLGAH